MAVKVVESRVQPGKTADLSREPLLAMSVSHPNLVQARRVGACRGVARPRVRPRVLVGRRALVAAREELAGSARCAWLQPGPTQPTHTSLPPSLPSQHKTKQTHKMCIVRLNPSHGGELPAAEPPAAGATGSSGSTGGGGSGGGHLHSGSGGRLVPAIDGSGALVEVVSPHAVLQPGLYETYLVSLV